MIFLYCRRFLYKALPNINLLYVLNSASPLRIYMVALIPTERFYKSNWIEYHRSHCSMIKDAKPNALLLGDSIVAGLSRYPNVWNEYFAPRNPLNLGIGGDRV